MAIHAKGKPLLHNNSEVADVSGPMLRNRASPSHVCALALPWTPQTIPDLSIDHAFYDVCNVLKHSMSDLVPLGLQIDDWWTDENHIDIGTYTLQFDAHSLSAMHKQNHIPLKSSQCH